MTHSSLLRLALLVVLSIPTFAAGCGTEERHSADSGPGGGEDAFVDPTTDAAVVPGNDAFVEPGNDAAVVDDPLNAAPTCTSGRMWRLGNVGSGIMNPGLACIDCHVTERRAPQFTAAGTVYPSGHEPNLCNGPNMPSAITIEVTDSTGRVATMSPNTVGNFYYQGALTPPLTAAVHYQGRTRTMVTPTASGDCNSCHTQDGTMDAPGRITLP